MALRITLHLMYFMSLVPKSSLLALTQMDAILMMDVELQHQQP